MILVLSMSGSESLKKGIVVIHLAHTVIQSRQLEVFVNRVRLPTKWMKLVDLSRGHLVSS
jgi:hypothetical protein